MNEGAVTARNTDTRTVKQAVQKSFGIFPDQNLGHLLLDDSIKVPHLCGYRSEITGRLLTPTHMSWDNLMRVSLIHLL